MVRSGCMLARQAFLMGLLLAQIFVFLKAEHPMLFFADWENNYGPTVMKFEENNWQLIGKKGIISEAASYESIAISNDGILYIAFRDVGKNYGASVMKFNGSDWEFVGERGFTDPTQQVGGPINLSLTLDNNGVPYIAYQDFTNGSIT